MIYWFSADLHLGHANIIKYCGRTIFMTQNELAIYNEVKNLGREEQKKLKISVESLRLMDEELIKRWNERVKSEDIVFFIGDFCFRNSPGGKEGEGTLIKAKEYESKLNGKFIFIKGNHDRNNSCKTIIERLVINYGGKRVNLTHNPEHADLNYEFNFCGHVHQHWKFKRIKTHYGFTNIINVGVDVNDFQPKTFEELMSQYNKWKKTLNLEKENEKN